MLEDRAAAAGGGELQTPAAASAAAASDGSACDDADDDEVNWLECISAIETPKGLLYFCDREYVEKSDALHAIDDLTLCLPPGAAELYSITAYNPHNKVADKLQNELANVELKGELLRLFPGCPVYNNFSFFPSRPHHFERGYTVAIPRDYSGGDGGGHDRCRVVHELALHYEQAAFFKCTLGSDGQLAPYVVLVQGQCSEIQETLSAIRRVAMHPAFLHEDNNALNDSPDDAVKVMSAVACTDQPYIAEFLDAFHQHCRPPYVLPHAGAERHPFLVVEGFNAAECAASVAKAVGADYSSWLPPCVAHLYPKFRSASTHLMAAFRVLVNYLQAALVGEKIRTACVVMDRYWHDTLASIIVTEIGLGSSNLPPKSHEVYDTWPAGLLQPDVVVWVKSCAKKESSANKRQMAPSDRVSVDAVLPLKTSLADETFRRMRDSSWIVVPGGTGDEVAIRVVDELRLRRHVLLASDRASRLGCPSEADAPPAPVHDILARRLLGRSLSAAGPGGDGEKPFWF